MKESDDDENRYLDYSYMEAIQKILKDNDFKEEFILYGNTLYSKEVTDLDKVVCVYGFKIMEFENFEQWDSSLETDKYQNELQRVKE